MSTFVSQGSGSQENFNEEENLRRNSLNEVTWHLMPAPLTSSGMVRLMDDEVILKSAEDTTAKLISSANVPPPPSMSADLLAERRSSSTSIQETNPVMELQRTILSEYERSLCSSQTIDFGTATAVLTNFRIVIISAITNTTWKTRLPSNVNFWAWALPLPLVKDATDPSSFISRSRRLNVSISTRPVQNSSDKPMATVAAPFLPPLNLEIRFNTPTTRESWQESLKAAIHKASWCGFPTLALQLELFWRQYTTAPLILSSFLPQKNVLQPASSTNTNTFSVSKAGVSGLIRRQEAELRTVDSRTKAALSDLDSLMKQAREMVDLVRKYSSYQESRNSRGSGSISGSASSSVTGASEWETMTEGGMEEVETMVLRFGIASPVTRSTAGRQFFKNLLLEIADFLNEPPRTNSGRQGLGYLDRVGGMLTLTDLYCILNRARGTALLSPDDLMSAITLLSNSEYSHLRLSVHTFPSGVKVIQRVQNAQTLTQFAASLIRGCPGLLGEVIDWLCLNETPARRQQLREQWGLQALSPIPAEHAYEARQFNDLRGILSPTTEKKTYGQMMGGVTVTEVAKWCHLPVSIAKERLRELESSGLLCRDEQCMHGLRYSLNLFLLSSPEPSSSTQQWLTLFEELRNEYCS